MHTLRRPLLLEVRTQSMPRAHDVAPEAGAGARVGLHAPDLGVVGDAGHAGAVGRGPGQARDAGAVEDRAAVRDVGGAVDGVVGAPDLRGEVLVAGAEAPVDVTDDDVAARRPLPRLVDVAAEDVPLVLQAGAAVQHDLAAGADQRVAGGARGRELRGHAALGVR